MEASSSAATELKEALRRGEYEAQFFQTPAISHSYSLKELILHHLRSCTDRLKGTLGGRIECRDEYRKMEKVIQMLREKYEAAVEKHSKPMEAKMFEIFNIPSYVLLPEDEAQIRQYTDEDVRRMDDEIEKLKSQYRRVVCMETLLRREKKTCANVDTLEKAFMEINDEVNTLSEIHEYNKQSSNLVSNGLANLRNLIDLHSSLLKQESNPALNGFFEKEKINGS